MSDTIEVNPLEEYRLKQPEPRDNIYGQGKPPQGVTFGFSNAEGEQKRITVPYDSVVVASEQITGPVHWDEEENKMYAHVDTIAEMYNQFEKLT